MKSIEEFRAEQEKALTRHAEMLKRAEAFAVAGFGVPEYIADNKTHGAVHIVYRNRSSGELRNMGAAVDMFKAFANGGAVVAQHVMRDGSFTVCHPEKHMPPKRSGLKPYTVDPMHSAPYAARIDVRHMGNERHHTSAVLEFFAMVGGVLYDVSIEFGTGYIGTCPKLAPSAQTQRDARNRIISRRYLPNTDARALSDHYLSYSYGAGGPIADGADHRFLFVADYDDDTQPADCSHALAQLENLAHIVDGGKE